MTLLLRHAPGRAPLPSGGSSPSARRRDPLRVVLFVLVVLDVSRLHQHYSILAALRPMQVLAACALLYAFLNPHLLAERWLWSRRWPARVVATLGVLACLSAIFGISFGGSARFILEDYVKVLILTFLLMATIRNTRDLTFYVWAYVVACGVLVWMSLFVFGITKAGPEGIYRLQNLYLYDANDLCVVLLAGLGLCLFTLQTSGRLGKVVTLVIMIGIGDVLARSGSRGGFVGLVAFAVAFLLMPTKASVVKRVAFIGVVAVALQLGSPEGYWRQMQTVLAPQEDYNWSSPTGRRMIAKRGIGYMESYPLFGVGINNFPRAEGTISERAQDWNPAMAGVRWIAPHNSYIQVGAEMGFPGGVLWTSLLVGGIVSCWRLRRRTGGRLAVSSDDQKLLRWFSETLPLSLVGFGVSAAFVSFAYLDPIYILAAYVTGMNVAFRAVEQRASSIIPSEPRARSPSGAVGLGISFTVDSALRREEQH